MRWTCQVLGAGLTYSLRGYGVYGRNESFQRHDSEWSHMRSPVWMNLRWSLIQLQCSKSSVRSLGLGVFQVSLRSLGYLLEIYLALLMTTHHPILAIGYSVPEWSVCERMMKFFRETASAVHSNRVFELWSDIPLWHIPHLQRNCHRCFLIMRIEAFMYRTNCENLKGGVQVPLP